MLQASSGLLAPCSSASSNASAASSPKERGGRKWGTDSSRDHEEGLDDGTPAQTPHSFVNQERSSLQTAL